MTSRALPILVEIPEHDYDADISGRAVRIKMTWLERTAGWYMDVSLPDGTPVVQGRRVASKRPPLEGLRILEIIGDDEVLIPFAIAPETRSAPASLVLRQRRPRPASASGLSVVLTEE